MPIATTENWATPRDRVGSATDDRIVVGGCQQGLVLIPRGDLAAYTKGSGCMAVLAAVLGVIEVTILMILG